VNGSKPESLTQPNSLLPKILASITTLPGAPVGARLSLSETSALVVRPSTLLVFGKFP